MKILVMGYRGSGKNSVCEILRDQHGLDFIDSSFAGCERAVFPLLRDRYATAADCYADKDKLRPVFFEAISAYNTPDKARLAREVFSLAPVYNGMRCKREFRVVRMCGLFDFSVWVDAGDRVEPEPETSCTVSAALADYQLDNTGPEADLPAKVTEMVARFRAAMERAAVALKTRADV